MSAARLGQLFYVRARDSIPCTRVKVLFYRSAFSHIMPYRPSTVTRDPEATRARAIEETSPSWYNLEVLSSDRPRATSSRLRTSWLKLASGSRDGHRRHAGLNGEGRTRAPSLCGIVVSYLRLGPELYGLPGACMRQAVVSILVFFLHF